MKNNRMKAAHTMTKQVIQTGDNYAVTFAACLKLVYAQEKELTESLSNEDKLIFIITDAKKPTLKRQAFDDSGVDYTLIIKGHKGQKIALQYQQRKSLHDIGLLQTTEGGFALPSRTNWQNKDEHKKYLSLLSEALKCNGFDVDFSRRDNMGYYSAA